MSERLEEMKAYASEHGIKFHPSIGEEALEEKIRSFEDAKNQDQKEAEQEAMPDVEKAESKTLNRRELKKEQLKLVRVRITCMNPTKKEWEGEIVTVSNALVGTVKKYIPFNAEEGWHVPQILLNFMKEREYQHFYITKDDRGNKVPRGKNMKEFAIEVLPPLTKKELEELANRQAMAGGV